MLHRVTHRRTSTATITVRPAVLLLLMTASLVACSTNPVPLSRATPVPVERVLSAQFTKPAEGAQEITLVRDSGIYGAALYSTIWVDGVKTLDLDTSESATLYLPKGAHFLTAGRNAAGAGVGPTVPINVPSTTKEYRVSEGQFLLPID